MRIFFSYSVLLLISDQHNLIGEICLLIFGIVLDCVHNARRRLQDQEITLPAATVCLVSVAQTGFIHENY